MRYLFWLIGFILLAVLFNSCVKIPYRDDVSYLNSAMANSAEMIVSINKSLCRDSEGRIGSCILSVRRNMDITAKMPPLPFSYKLSIICSSRLGFEYLADVEVEKEHTVVIEHDLYGDNNNFVCVGEVSPHKDIPASAKFVVMVLLVDESYVSRESIYYTRKHLVLGEYAKYSIVNGEFYNKQTVVKSDKNFKAMSISGAMRINYYGY